MNELGAADREAIPSCMVTESNEVSGKPIMRAHGFIILRYSSSCGEQETT